jgi:hypothetical protein
LIQVKGVARPMGSCAERARMPYGHAPRRMDAR